MSYRNLEVWSMARNLVGQIHQMSLTCLPKFEMFETGSQIRRSSKSIKSNIVEGYGRRSHKADYIRFLEYAQSSCLETEDHLDTLVLTKSLTDAALAAHLQTEVELLLRKLTSFIHAVADRHIEPPRVREIEDETSEI